MRFNFMKVFYVCRPDDEYEVYHPLYITLNEQQARGYWRISNDESVQAIICSKELDKDEPIFKGDPYEDDDKSSLETFEYTFHNLYNIFIKGDMSEEEYGKYTEYWLDGRPTPEKIWELK